MKRKKNISLSLLLAIGCYIFFSMNGNGQTTEEVEHRKYWYYKSRFNNDFVKVGLNQGESIPFGERGYGTVVIDSRNTIPSYSNMMFAGDEGSSIGLYLAVLATEYRLLRDAGKDLSIVKHEIFCALNSINRIDYFFEATVWNNPKPLNGCISRGDIPDNFLQSKQNYDHFNYYNTWDGSTPVGPTWTPSTIGTDRGFNNGPLHSGQYFLQSTYSYLQTGHHVSTNSGHSWRVFDKYDMAASQDHYITLLLGLSMIKELVDAGDSDNGASFPFEQTSVTDLRQEAKNISGRIMGYITQNPWRLLHPDGTPISDDSGGNCWAYAWAFAEVGGFATDNYFPEYLGFGISPALGPQSTLYHDFYSSWSGIGFSIFQAAGKAIGTTKDIAVQLAELSATGNPLFTSTGGYFATQISHFLQTILPWWNIGNALGAIIQDVVSIVSVWVPQTWDNTTNYDMFTNVNHWQIPWLMYARSIMHGHTDYNFENGLQYGISPDFIMPSAPCEGPWNFSNKNIPQAYYASYPWSSNDRLEHPDRLGSNTDFPGEYPGLDYMLYHNLYYLYHNRKGDIGSYSAEDLSTRQISYSFPNGTIGAVANHATIGGFEYIKANNIVNNNADVSYRAGKNIELKPGFSAVNGAYFQAYILPYTGCDMTNNNNFRMDQVSPGYDTDNGEFELALHHIDYPTTAAKQKNNQYKDSHTLPWGNSDISPSMGSLTVNSEISVVVYPNPSNGKFTIIIPWTERAEEYIVSVYDLKGVLVYNKKIEDLSSDLQLDLSELLTGSYIIKILTVNGRQALSKINNSK